MTKVLVSRLVLFVFAAALSETVFADPFIGISGGSGRVTYKEELNILGVTQSSSGSSATTSSSFRIGSKDESGRAYLNWSVLTYTDATAQAITISSDHFFGSDTIKLLLGTSIGIAKLTWETDDPFGTGINWGFKGESASSLTLGGRVGTLISLGRSADLEIAYSIYAANLRTELSTVTTKYDLTVRSLSTLLVGVNINL